MSVILCYGDSNTHGTRPKQVITLSERYPPGVCWTDVMAARLGPAHRVLSEGLPGRTTVHDDPVEGGARNGLAVLPAILHSHKPIDLMILMLGTNDLKPRFAVSAYEIARAVERMVLVTRTHQVVRDIIVVDPPPVREAGCLDVVFEGAEARQSGLTAHLEAMATRQGCGFVAAGAHIAVSAADGVHWEADAHARFGEVMAQQVQERLS